MNYPNDKQPPLKRGPEHRLPVVAAMVEVIGLIG
jgi:hypothetical protein